ncbi:MAG: class I SAM-dependent methyltransferase [Flavobacteriales bacterium]|jgi:hypothetical protein|nr:class I SAM-dependent methyltransferase [Flavobacteriales bacterium]
MTNPTRPDQERIFRELYEKNKGTPMAVSSESLAHKRLRFGKVTDLVGDDDDFTVHDVGMGVADLYAFMQERFAGRRFTYSGTEILEEYVQAARERFPDVAFHHRDLADAPGTERYDYVLMSGVFHQRRESSIRLWERFAQDIIRNSFAMCRKGIAFNFISPFVDFYQTQVYYANLPKLINFINDDLSRFFEIRHNYALFEFTVFVYKEDHIRTLHPEPEFAKYFKA